MTSESPAPLVDSFEAGARGKGFEERLIACTFSETFTDTFTLDEETAGLFGIPGAYIGTQVTVQGRDRHRLAPCSRRVAGGFPGIATFGQMNDGPYDEVQFTA